ncbi:MAG: YdcF family protein [Flavipsychrobacter sp.]
MQADVIVILGYPVKSTDTLNDVLLSRLDKGIDLFRYGFARKIIVSGAAVHNNIVEAEVMAAYCIKNEIPPESLILERKARNTYENALYSVRLMKQLNYNSAIVVTSSFHKQRADYLFSRFIAHYSVEGAPFPKSFTFLRKTLFLVREKLMMLWYIFMGNEWLYNHTTKQLKSRRTKL